MNRSALYTVIAVLVVAIAVLGYRYYEEQQTSGVAVEFGNGSLSVKTK